MIKPKTRKEKLLSAIANDTKVPIQPKNREELFLAQIAEKTSNVPKPLTYDYMPEGYPKKEVGIGSITWDGNTAGLTVHDGEFYKVSDMVFTQEQLAPCTIKVVTQSGVVEFPFSDTTIVNQNGAFYAMYNGLPVIVFVDATVAGSGAGLYFVKKSESVYTTELSGFEALVTKPISYEFMPEGYPKKFEHTIVEEMQIEVANAGSAYLVDLPTYVELITGDRYTVTLNGEMYSVTAMERDEYIYIGNGSLDGLAEDTGEPFVIVSWHDSSNDEKGSYFAGENAGLVTIKVDACTVEKMDSAFLPEGYPKIDREAVKIFDQTVEGFEGSSGIYMAPFLDATFELVEGDKYTVVWDGVEYAGLIAFAQVEDVVIGADSMAAITEDLPFMIVYNNERGSVVFTISTGSSHAISITHISEVITPMSEEFLPEGIGGGLVITNDEDGNYLVNMSFDEAYAAMASGVMPVYISSEEGVGTVFRCTGIRFKPGTYIRMEFESSFSSGDKVAIRYDNDGIGLDALT